MKFFVAAVLAAATAYSFFFSHRDESAISPTAHYTGYVWVRNGMSDIRLLTPQGKILYYLLEPLMMLSKLQNGPTVEEFLLARHDLIDFQLEQQIENGKITQIIELGAGLSPRGLRFRKKYGSKIAYIEADLPGMSGLKRDLIGDSLHPDFHKIESVNLLLEDGPGSLHELVRSLDTNVGTAIVTEGVLNYFDEATVLKIWKAISSEMSLFPYGSYVSDIHLDQDSEKIVVRTFRWLLSTFVRGKVHLLFPDRLAAEWGLINAGFLSALVHRPQDWADEVVSCNSPGARMVHVITALVNPK